MRYESDPYLLASDIRNYLKSRIPARTLYDWLKPLTEEWRDNKKKRKRQELLDSESLIKDLDLAYWHQTSRR